MDQDSEPAPTPEDRQDVLWRACLALFDAHVRQRRRDIEIHIRTLTERGITGYLCGPPAGPLPKHAYLGSVFSRACANLLGIPFAVTL